MNQVVDAVGTEIDELTQRASRRLPRRQLESVLAGIDTVLGR